MLEFLPREVQEALNRVNENCIYEIRMRAGKPVTVNFGGEYRYLGLYGLTDRSEEAIKPNLHHIEDIVYRAGNCSVYSVEEQIRRGFVTANGGERIGIAGEFVTENGKVVTVRNVSSVCIRIPHVVEGCASEVYKRCFSDGLKNVLIASAPGFGKTTFLRDLTAMLCKETKKNILICDERGEISSADTGESTDVFRFSDKGTAFEAGLRAMRPDIVVTDELSENDIFAVRKAVAAGVNVLASAHLFRKEDIPDAFLGVFDRYVFLRKDGIGKISSMYDRDIKEVCMT